MKDSKVRVWDKACGEFLNDDSFIGHYDDLYFSDFLKILRDDNYIFQYSIGKKDEEKKEIFDGDILQRGKDIYYISFDDGRFLLKNSFTYSGHREIGSGSSYKIIGNILQNKNIIEEVDRENLNKSKDIEAPCECRSKQHRNRFDKQFLR